MQLAKLNTKETITTLQLREMINSARTAAGETEIRNSDFLTRVADELDFDGNENFATVTPSGGGTPSKSYTITIEQATLVGMRESKAVRRGVLAVLKAMTTPALPQTMAEALRLAADQAEQIEQQQKQLELAAPKVAFVDKFVERTTLQNATQVGQTFGMSAVKLNRTLDELGGVYNKSCKRGRAFVQSWTDSGFGEMKQNDIGYPQALFTTKGIEQIAAMFSSEGIA